MRTRGIIGLTDRGPALTRIGTLRKGAPKTGNKPGADLKHFRFTSEFPEVALAFEKAYGKEPTSINVFLLYDEVEDSFSAAREHWLAGGLKHRCNGETMSVWQENGNYYTGSKPCPEREKPEKLRLCKPVGRLSVLIPDLERIATVTVLTTSKHDIMALQESLEGAKWVQGGKLRGIPFLLTRREREISTPGEDGKRSRRKKSLLVIEPAHHYAIAQLRAIDVTPLLLPAGSSSVEDDEDGDDELVDPATGEIFAPSPDPSAPVLQTAVSTMGPTDEDVKNLSNWLKWAYATTGIKRQADILALVGVENVLQIKDFRAAAETLLANVPNYGDRKGVGK